MSRIEFAVPPDYIRIFGIREMGFKGHFAQQLFYDANVRFGSNQTSDDFRIMSALPSKADIAERG